MFGLAHFGLFFQSSLRFLVYLIDRPIYSKVLLQNHQFLVDGIQFLVDDPDFLVHSIEFLLDLMLKSVKVTYLGQMLGKPLIVEHSKVLRKEVVINK